MASPVSFILDYFRSENRLLGRHPVRWAMSVGGSPREQVLTSSFGLLKKNSSNKRRPPSQKTFSPPSQWAGAVPCPQLLVTPKRWPQGESGLPRGDLGTNSLDTWKNLDPCLTSSWLHFFYPHSGMFPGSDLRSVPSSWPLSLVFPYIQESTINSLDEMQSK